MRCPNCNYLNTTASLLCAQCGNRLLPHQVQATIPVLDDLLEAAENIKKTEYSPPEAALALFVSGQEKPLLVKNVQELLLGRVHQTKSSGPAIDYELAAKSGISRRHALITHAEGHYTITDLESTNGTRLNGKPLLAHMPYVLNSGDQIRLGTLTMYIYF